MSLSERLQRWIEKWQQWINDRKEEMKKGAKVTMDGSYKEKKREERWKKRMERPPGARRSIEEGLRMHQGPLTVMRNELRRRKYEREQKK